MVGESEANIREWMDACVWMYVYGYAYGNGRPISVSGCVRVCGCMYMRMAMDPLGGLTLLSLYIYVQASCSRTRSGSSGSWGPRASSTSSSWTRWVVVCFVHEVECLLGWVLFGVHDDGWLVVLDVQHDDIYTCTHEDRRTPFSPSAAPPPPRATGTRCVRILSVFSVH